MLRISVFGLAIISNAFAVFCWITLPATLSSSVAIAQQDDSFGAIADLVFHRGFDVGAGWSPELASIFGTLQRPKVYSLQVELNDPDDVKALKKVGYPEGWSPSIWTWIEQGAMKVFLTAQKENKVSGSGYAFLTGLDGRLQKVARGKKQGGLFHWSPAAIDSDAQSLFDKTVAYWVHPDSKKEIEGLPNKR